MKSVLEKFSTQYCQSKSCSFFIYIFQLKWYYIGIRFPILLLYSWLPSMHWNWLRLNQSFLALHYFQGQRMRDGCRLILCVCVTIVDFYRVARSGLKNKLVNENYSKISQVMFCCSHWFHPGSAD